MIGTASLILFALIGVQAQPRGITLRPVNDCSALPNYNNMTNISGPWTIRIDGCSNGTASRDVCSIESVAASCDVKRSADEKGIQKGSITIADGPNGVTTMFRCNGALQTFEALVPSGAGALDWHAIGIDSDPSTAEIEWGMGRQKTEPVEVYRQYVHGSPVGGLFLGSKGHITWAVHHSGSGLSSVDRKPFWFLRLLGPETKTWSDEYGTFIQFDDN